MDPSFQEEVIASSGEIIRSVAILQEEILQEHYSQARELLRFIQKHCTSLENIVAMSEPPKPPRE